MSAKSIGTSLLYAVFKRQSMGNGRNFTTLRPNHLTNCGCRTLCSAAKPTETNESKPTNLAKQAEVKRDISVSKLQDKSFAKGLFLNTLRPTDMVYPEIPDTEELLALEDFCAAIRRYNNSNVDSREIDKQREIPSEVLHKLGQMGIFGLQIPKEFGGLGFNEKEYCAVYEAMSQDWSILTNWIVTHDLVAKAILTFGTEEQKRLYLPQLAKGEIKGAFCLHEDHSGHDIADLKTFAQFSAAKDGNLVLRGVKNWVTNGSDADLLIVFGKLCEYEAEDLNTIPSTAFIIDRRLHGDRIKVLERKDTTGLRGVNICDLEFNHVCLKESDVLGSPREGFRIATEIVRKCQYPFGAAAASFVKRQLTAIESRVNKELRFERRMADSVAVKKRVSDMSMNAYVLESMSFFIAGMKDEDSTRDFSLEGAMIKWFAIRSLRESLLSAMAILGAKSMESSAEVERHLRDITTLSAFMTSEDMLSGYVAMEGLQAWAQSHSGEVEKSVDYMKYPSQMIKRKFSRRGFIEYKPKYQHYINEMVHPSLEPAARFCEEVMFKFEDIFVDCYVHFSQQIEDEQQLLDRLTEVSTLIFAMLTVISRSSRSYSIGLQNSDLELFMAHNFCRQSRLKILHLLADLESIDETISGDASMKRIGEKMLEQRGYLIENMVNVAKGVLITCDPAMKQFLLHLDETLALGQKFVIADLDETHLFVSADIVATLKSRVDSLMESQNPDLA